MRTPYHTARILMSVAGLLLLTVMCVLPRSVFAQIPLEVGIGATSQITEPYLANYIVQSYQFIVGSIGVIAAVMIMFNGMRWVTAGGNSENISVARTGISNAIIGLLIALTSYVLLNAVNPSLVGFQDLEMTELEFRVPVTTSEAAITSGDIADDESLIAYMDQLPPELLEHLNNTAGVPYITQATFDALTNALKILDDPSSPYYGMKLKVSGANRSLATQERFWACYQKYPPKSGLTCPSGCQNPGGDGCNVAAKPGESLHGYGTALDASWSPDTGGKYVSITSYLSSTFHKDCLVSGTMSASSGCTDEVKESILHYNTMMQQAGFQRICIEWWHEQVSTPGSSKSICDPGTYK